MNLRQYLVRTMQRSVNSEMDFLMELRVIIGASFVCLVWGMLGPSKLFIGIKCMRALVAQKGHLNRTLGTFAKSPRDLSWAAGKTVSRPHTPGDPLEKNGTCRSFWH